MKKIYQALIVQRNLLLRHKKNSNELHCLQFYLWHCYHIRPIYFTQRDCRHAIENLAILFHNPEQSTKFMSNGTIRIGQIDVKTPLMLEYDNPKLPNNEPGTFLTFITCRMKEARYLFLLHGISRFLTRI